MESRKSVQNLAQTIHSLLGLKAHFTFGWVQSVCDIIKHLPSEGPLIDWKSANFKTGGSFGKKDDDLDGAISKIKCKYLVFIHADVSLFVQGNSPLSSYSVR